MTGGLAFLGTHNETKLYDACDCPNCGCQHIYQERKRIANLIDLNISMSEIKENSEDDSESEVSCDAWTIQDMVWNYIQDDHSFVDAAIHFGIPRNAILSILDQRCERTKKQ